MFSKSILGLATALIVLMGCSGNKNQQDSKLTEEVGKSPFKQVLEGKEVDLYWLKNKNGMAVSITNYGGRIVNLMVPDVKGSSVDVVLGYNDLDGYLTSNEVYFGALIGRNGNRIADAQFSIDGKTYQLAKNNGPNNLHGGPKGFHNQVWEVKKANDNKITLSYWSKDGEEGFPGNLKVEVDYSLTNNNELVINYRAETDQTTPVNLTNHAFFNLNGDASGTINDHILQVFADQYTPVDSTLIPLGENARVDDTPFDFRQPTAIGQRVNEENEQLTYGLGYDHNFVLTKGITPVPELAAVVYGDKSGINMEIETTEPGLQFYGGNFMAGKDVGKNGTYEYRGAFCLETQHFPDAVNQENFDSVLLNPGEKYTTKSIYRFSTVTE